MSEASPDLDALRAQIRRIERGPGAADAPVVPLGIEAVDRALPWGGLPRGAVHEIMTPDPADGAATAFLAVVAGRLAAPGSGHLDGDGFDGPVLWVSGRGDLFPPGLARYGWRPERILSVRTDNAADTLWAMEDGLRCPALAAVAGDVGELDFAVTRRLQLAAAAQGVPLLLHRPWRPALAASAALTRWRVAGARSVSKVGGSEVGEPVWRLDLLRCRGGRPQGWTVAWDPETGALRRADTDRRADAA